MNRLLILLLIILFLTIIVLIYSVSKHLLKENMDTKYTLGLLVIAKNESMVVEEYIKHYLWQGVEQIYFIDNGSTDDTIVKLEPYIQKKQLQYFNMPETHKQAEHYNYVYNSVAKNECEWLIVCDMDEYIYNRNEGKTIKDYLSEVDYNKVYQVRINWKMFGSSGLETQPSEIRSSFLYRKKDIDSNTKSIVNTKLVINLFIHAHEGIPDTETIWNPPQLSLNHYAIMSKEYFSKIKMTRGDAASNNFDNFRDWNYFERYDFKEVYDDELKVLVENQSKML